MTLRTRIEPVETFVGVVVRQDLSPPARSAAVARFARERLSEAQQANRTIFGRVPPHTVAVDGRPNAPPESVKADGGRIVFEFELTVDVLRWIADTLDARSPVVSGAYKRGHTLFADGREIPRGAPIPPADDYSFSNVTPYSRKVEIGKTKSGRAFVIQVPNRIYERTARDARARFGNVARIELTYRGIVGGAVVAGRAGNRSALRYPTIVVRPS